VTYYIVKLLIIIPLMSGLIYGALWLYRRYQPGLALTNPDKRLKLVETLPLGTAGKLAVIEFSGENILISVTRGQIHRIANRNGKPICGNGNPASTFEEILNATN